MVNIGWNQEGGPGNCPAALFNTQTMHSDEFITQIAGILNGTQPQPFHEPLTLEPTVRAGCGFRERDTSFLQWLDEAGGFR